MKDMNFLTELRKEREPLAITLQKHKGIRRILEDFYPDNAHFIYELLQNAEDADAQHAWFELHKDQLVFTHDGTRHFDEHDVSSITDIGDSSKREDAEKIGKFGVGFKSVFVYTETPCIYSKKFSFRITSLVLPEAIPPKPEIGNKTRFEFPFNSPKKSAGDAFSEIKSGLEALSETTLLFLSNLRTISWHIENSRSSVSRIEHPDNHIEIYKKSDTDPISGFHWLRFTAPVDGLPKQNVAVAYQLNFFPKVKIFESKELLSKQMEITPSQGRVSVFFPAEKELSRLRFHLHAPFVPELSRASIKDTPANLPLFDQLANLAAKSLHTIRDLGLLTGDVLSVLPNPVDELPPRYAPIRQAIINEMQNEPLTPTHNKSHAPARQLVQAKAVLKDLISENDLRYFMEGENEEPKWSIGARQKNSDQDRFLAGLGIQNWDVAEFIGLLKEKVTESEYSWGCKPDEKFLIWLGSKSDEWHQQMYSVLYQELKDDGFSQLRDVKIARLSDGTYSVGRKCYFPTNGVDRDDLMPRVARAVFSSGAKKIQQAEAKKLLEGIGVREIGEAEEVERILKERYSQGSNRPDDKTYLADFKRFMEFVENSPINRSLKDLLERSFIFKTEDDKWARPEEVFLDLPYKETLLSAYYKCKAESEKRKSILSIWYKEAGIDIKQLNEFAEAVGVQISLYIEQTNCNNNPQKDYLYSAPGQRFTIYGENRDHTIPGLESLLSQQSIKISQLLWKTMCSAPTKVLQAEYRNNIPAGSHYADSLLVHWLRRAKWVPQKGGIFVKPSHASRSQLPKGFPFDEGYEWLKAIEFGEDEKKQSEEFRQREKKRIELGFESEDALGRAQEFAKLPEEEQKRILSEHKQRRDFELPENSVSNPQRRAQKLAEQAKNAPERVSEERTRSVSVGVEEVKAKADQYLRQQYTNVDGQMICQVCKAELPFKKDDGDYYFERVEFLADLPGRHRENYLVLCPNHAAMFQHANGSKELLEPMLKELEGTELEVVLAQRDMTIYFTETHITDLKAVISSVRRQEDNPEVRP